MSQVLVGEIVDWLAERYPVRLAEPWDVVGLTIGRRGAPVHRIGFTVEVSEAVVAEAAAAGCELIVAHHPVLLRGIQALDLDAPKGRLVESLLTAGISVVVAHTNADVAPGGVADCLADALGLSGERRPLRPVPADEVDKLITFVPPEHAEPLIDSLAAAGAGRIGAYERCVFTSAGVGSYLPSARARPFIGQAGAIEAVAETRLEMVLPRSARAAVVRALLAVHPYEAPAFDLVELAGAPASCGLGRVGRLASPVPLGVFAERVAEALPRTAAGIRFAGEPTRPIETVAVQAGAGDDLLIEARRSGADVYLTSDLRHHPASDALAWPGGPALVDVPHWAAEWTWLPVVAAEVGAAFADRDLTCTVSNLVTDPWTGHAG